MPLSKFSNMSLAYESPKPLHTRTMVSQLRQCDYCLIAGLSNSRFTHEDLEAQVNMYEPIYTISDIMTRRKFASFSLSIHIMHIGLPGILNSSINIIHKMILIITLYKNQIAMFFPSQENGDLDFFHTESLSFQAASEIKRQNNM